MLSIVLVTLPSLDGASRSSGMLSIVLAGAGIAITVIRAAVSSMLPQGRVSQEVDRDAETPALIVFRNIGNILVSLKVTVLEGFVRL